MYHNSELARTQASRPARETKREAALVLHLAGPHNGAVNLLHALPFALLT
ncbi:MAG TPA: hypothetical protein VGT03_03355 [Candidatus Acidoferrales bacterium]|nr:hypothetical protein [Candidatus Acidoferrales bacterium]